MQETRPRLHVQWLTPSMDFGRAKLTLHASGLCSECGASMSLALDELAPGETTACAGCGQSLEPSKTDIQRLGKSLVKKYMDSLERHIAPWPEHAASQEGKHSRFDCYSTMNEYLKDVRLDVRAQDELSLLMALALELRPWLLVRFGAMQSSYFGHMSMNTENYLSRRDVGIGFTDSYDIFGYGQFVINRQLKRKWDEVLNTSQTATVFASMMPWDSPHSITKEVFANQGADSAQIWRKTEPHLCFSEEELRYARSELERRGIQPESEYVCIGERTSAYRKTILNANKFKQTSNSRDAGFDQFSLAAMALADRGYFVLRMGAASDLDLCSSHPRIIDYASKYRSEFMDLYLGATCRFFAAPPSGVTSIASIFRRPIVFSNYFYTKFTQHWLENILFLLPHLYNKNTQTHLSLAEYALLDQPPGDRWENYGVTFVSNTPEEMLHACLEMDDRLSGVWTETEEDRLRQTRVRQQLESSVRGKKSPNGIPFWESGTPMRSLVGSRFLKDNPALFGPGAMTTSSFEHN